MRALIQRVREAKVLIEDEIYSEIGVGLLVLVAYEGRDTLEDIKWMMEKIVKQRIFSDDMGKMNLSVQDIGGSVMLVSQFTLFASTKKGNRPSFIASAPPEQAELLYEQTLSYTSTLVPDKVASGKFGAHMEVALTNDGPVTIWMDTHNKE